MLSGKMLYAVHEGTYVIKLCGDVRVSLCATIDDFLDRMFHDPELCSVLIDLTEAESIDSTTLGLLAKVSLNTQPQCHCSPTIVSTNPDITRVLSSMGFEKVFNIIDEEPQTSAAWDEMPLRVTTDKEVCAKVLEAHKILMTLNERNQLTFQSVVAALENEQNRYKNPSH